MHRSGTSALARVINLLGAKLPEDLMVAGEGNEIGHWESQSIADFNDELLATAGSRWNDWLPFNNSWNRSIEYPSFLASARDLLEAEYRKSPLFVLKDPRICRLAGFWLQVIESLDIRPVIVLPQRNPIEVSASLAARDGSQMGFGLLLWLRHVLDAEAATRGKSRCFVSYEQLLADWTEVAADVENCANFTFPRRSVLADEEIASFLLDDARHQRETPAVATSTSTPVWVRETYAIMQRWCKTSETAKDRARLDRIRAAFDTAAPTFAQLASKGMAIGDGAGSANAARRELEAIRAEFAQFQEQSGSAIRELQNSLVRHQDLTTQAQAEAEARRASEDQLRTGLEEILGRSAELEKAILQQREIATEAQTQASALQDSQDRMKAELEKVSNRTIELESALLQRQEEAAQAWAQAEEHRLELESMVAALKHSSEQNELLDEAVADARGRLDAVSQECSAAETKAQKMKHVAESLAQRLNDAQSSIRTLEDDLAQQRIQSTLHAERTESATQIVKARLAEHQREVRRLQADLSEATDRGKISDARADWLRKLAELLMKKPGWWALLPTHTRLRLEGQMVRRSGLFDGESYLDHNPDVRAGDIDPLVHYLRCGMDEDRSW